MLRSARNDVLRSKFTRMQELNVMPIYFFGPSNLSLAMTFSELCKKSIVAGYLLPVICNGQQTTGNNAQIYPERSITKKAASSETAFYIVLKQFYSFTSVFVAGLSKYHSLLSSCFCCGYTSLQVLPSYNLPFFITYCMVFELRILSNGF